MGAVIGNEDDEIRSIVTTKHNSVNIGQQIRYLPLPLLLY